MGTIEEVVRLNINSNTTNRAEIRFTPPAGFIIGCVIYVGDTPDISNYNIQASIKETNNNYISKPQDIRNYRSREASYINGVKPLLIQADGRTYIFTIETKDGQNMRYNINAELILVYQNPCATNL